VLAGNGEGVRRQLGTPLGFRLCLGVVLHRFSSFIGWGKAQLQYGALPAKAEEQSDAGHRVSPGM
jgi:hypothetical protein